MSGAAPSSSRLTPRQRGLLQEWLDVAGCGMAAAAQDEAERLLAASPAAQAYIGRLQRLDQELRASFREEAAPAVGALLRARVRGALTAAPRAAAGDWAREGRRAWTRFVLPLAACLAIAALVWLQGGYRPRHRAGGGASAPSRVAGAAASPSAPHAASDAELLAFGEAEGAVAGEILLAPAPALAGKAGARPSSVSSRAAEAHMAPQQMVPSAAEPRAVALRSVEEAADGQRLAPQLAPPELYAGQLVARHGRAQPSPEQIVDLGSRLVEAGVALVTERTARLARGRELLMAWFEPGRTEASEAALSDALALYGLALDADWTLVGGSLRSLLTVGLVVREGDAPIAAGAVASDAAEIGAPVGVERSVGP